MLTPKKTTPLPLYLRHVRSKRGASSRHGMHQDAQKFTTTGPSRQTLARQRVAIQCGQLEIRSVRTDGRLRIRSRHPERKQTNESYSRNESNGNAQDGRAAALAELVDRNHQPIPRRAGRCFASVG